MLGEFMQYLFSGLTSGAIYALVGLGFALIYNASHVINFAQGEFVMLGGMSTVFLSAAGVPLPVAVLLAVAATAVVGLALEKLAVEQTKNASVVTLIIITIGASIVIRGAAQVIFDKQFHTLPAFTGDAPINVLGATITPQTLWVLGVTVAIVLVLQWFFNRTLWGKAILATSVNPLAAKLVGINTNLVLLISFGLSAALGAIAGVLITPITSTNFEVGIMLGLKGFSAAILGGLGSPFGAVAGGLILGIVEAFGAGYISSEYKDAMAFVIILLALFFMPSGLFGKRGTDRV
ncbi:branched-chain amino acid ABC transporter permease [Caenispirillum bisanense]|uniref:Amino acid/amide ABC transporter membrane protein 1, HAAT family n=1 Tax=Caenispirillum bisanense TaxID=414052 RepID=A0A286G238_9PROT|nr:branched-chain amino acid ABC transporter permease [Caenispirillum bisanense]SOD89522.1 amino acid/amide ABC transporter membrane protein 1, HAAT family [Caenispirillum bisanense]